VHAIWRDLKLIVRGNRTFRNAEFEIRLKGTWEMEYRYGTKVIAIPTGIGKGTGGWYDNWVTIELPKQPYWHAPSREPLSATELSSLIKNIEIGFDAMDIPAELIYVK
jgi:hypothetical protein